MTYIINVSDPNELESIIYDMSMLRLLLRYSLNFGLIQPRYIIHKYPTPRFRFTSIHKQMILNIDNYKLKKLSFNKNEHYFYSDASMRISSAVNPSMNDTHAPLGKMITLLLNQVKVLLITVVFVIK